MKVLLRFASGILVPVMLLLMISCAAEAPEQADESAAAVLTAGPETGRPYPVLPDVTYDGYVFNILCFDNAGANQWTGIPSDLTAEEETGEPLNDSVFLRNRRTEERFGIVITSVYSSDTTNKLRASVMAADDDYDAVFPRMYDLPALIGADLLFNLGELPDVDLAAPWWDVKSVEALNMNGKLFGAVCDITYIDKLSTYVVYYNKNLAGDYNLDSVNETVLDGSWTWEKMNAAARDVSNDVDGDGKMTQSDAYGVACQNDAAYIYYHAAGLLTCETDSEGYPEFVLGEEKNLVVMQEIYDIMNDTGLFFNRQTYGMSVLDAITMFIENRVLFLIRPVQTMLALRDMQADFGIIPMPKYSESQDDYHSAVNPYTAVLLCLPKVMGDVERSSAVIESLAADSRYEVMPAFYDLVIGRKLVRDEQSTEMLDRIFSARVYDIGCIWNFGDFLTGIITKFDQPVASNIASMQNAVGKGIDELRAVIG